MDLNQITIYATDTRALVEFYERLGLRRIVDSLPRYARLECPDGNSTLSVHSADSDQPSGIVLYFECADLDSEVIRLKSLGLDFEQDPKDQDWLWREAYLRDPSGNRICLFHAGVNRKDPPWKVKSTK
ncbi:MAG TPA: VOC family protein [Pyrinomonadaceae bacterium]|nr:VOC family protein [Pyrinomonadaceae bacterium]